MGLTKKKAMAAMAACLAAVTCVGSFAFFTDRHETSAGATAGNIDLVFSDESDSSAYAAAQGNTQTAKSVWGVDGAEGVIATKIINPGDKFDMGYKITNTGSKSIDVKEQLIVTVTDKNDAALALTSGTEEFDLVITDNANVKATLNATETNLDEGKIVYDIAKYTLTGTVENDATLDGEVDGAAGVDHDLYLEFDKEAKNAFMDAKVTVELDVQAKQHRNTEDTDFATWAEFAADTVKVEKIN